MQYLQEVTEWDVGYSLPNHIYYLSDDKRKAVGYIKAGTKKLVKFSKPLSFDTKGRKFIKVERKAEPDAVYFPKAVEEKPIGHVKQVEGSGGKIYFISKIGTRYSCSCPGFQFRHKCRHVEEMAK